MSATQKSKSKIFSNFISCYPLKTLVNIFKLYYNVYINKLRDMRSQLSPVLFLKNLSFYPLLTDNGRKLKKTVAKIRCFPTF